MPKKNSVDIGIITNIGKKQIIGELRVILFSTTDITDLADFH